VTADVPECNGYGHYKSTVKNSTGTQESPEPVRIAGEMVEINDQQQEFCAN
jgi:hypothetical protein